MLRASQVALVVKNPPANASGPKRWGFDPREDPRKTPLRRASNSLLYSCLENPMDRGTWWATVHRIAKSRKRVKHAKLCMQAHRNMLYYIHVCVGGGVYSTT